MLLRPCPQLALPHLKDETVLSCLYFLLISVLSLLFIFRELIILQKSKLHKTSVICVDVCIVKIWINLESFPQCSLINVLCS